MRYSASSVTIQQKISIFFWLISDNIRSHVLWWDSGVFRSYILYSVEYIDFIHYRCKMGTSSFGWWETFLIPWLINLSKIHDFGTKSPFSFSCLKNRICRVITFWHQLLCVHHLRSQLSWSVILICGFSLDFDLWFVLDWTARGQHSDFCSYRSGNTACAVTVKCHFIIV